MDQNQVALVEDNSCPLGVQLVNTKRTNKPSASSDLVELAQAVQKADEFTRAAAYSKLSVIAEQIRFLQEQARKVLEESKQNALLHHAACNLVKKPGTIYYLYQRESGQSYFSILSPQEWGKSCPHQFLGAYRLEFDQTWTPFTVLEQKDKELAFLDQVFNAQQALAGDDIMELKKSSNLAQISDRAVGQCQES